MDYPTNGAGSSEPTMDANEIAQNAKEYAADAAESLNAMVERGKEIVVRYPLLTVAGAVAAGWLFAKVVARRR